MGQKKTLDNFCASMMIHTINICFSITCSYELFIYPTSPPFPIPIANTIFHSWFILFTFNSVVIRSRLELGRMESELDILFLIPQFI
jgi:hypothetical protein